MPQIRIYSAQVCPFAQRTNMVLAEKGLTSELTEIDLADKPDWFGEISPYLKVPVLVHGQDRVYESAIINEYLEELYPEPGLMPKDAMARASVRIWIDYCDTKFIPTFYKLLLSQDEDKRAELRHTLLGQLEFIEQEGLAKLSGHGPYWLGADLSLLDIAFYPFFERFVLMEHYRGVEIPTGCSRLKAWLKAVAARDSAKATGNSRDYYIARYTKYADGTADGVTARELRAS